MINDGTFVINEVRKPPVRRRHLRLRYAPPVRGLGGGLLGGPPVRLRGGGPGLLGGPPVRLLGGPGLGLGGVMPYLFSF